MVLEPTQGNEKTHSVRQTTFHGSTTPHLSSRAKSRDLQFYGPFVEMFFDSA
jgi:hypothetical protein